MQNHLSQRAPRHFLETDKISKHLYCSFCHEVYDIPTRMRCGHTFCYSCMLNWRKISKKCPQCKAFHKNWIIEKDFIASHIIDDLRTKCSFGGCEWTGLYSGLKKHQRFCTFREKKKYDCNDQQAVPIPDEMSDNDVQEIENQNYKGQKKIKTNEEFEDGMPQFPQSSNQAEQIDMQPLQPKRRSSSQPDFGHEFQAVRGQFNGSQRKSSSSDDDYLETDMKKMFKKSNPKFRNNFNLSEFMECGNGNNKHCEEDKNEKNISRQMRDISFEDNFDQFRLYPNQLVNSKKKFQKPTREQQIYEEQQDFFRFLDKKDQQPQNYYLLRKHQQQEEREKKEKQQKRVASRWKVVHPSSSKNSKAQDSDSSNMSNPFDQPIPDKLKKKKKRSKIRDVIILDSSDEMIPVQMSKQSGQMSEKLFNHPISRLSMQATRHPDSNWDSPKDTKKGRTNHKAQIEKKMLPQCEENSKFLFQFEVQKQSKIKDESFDY